MAPTVNLLADTPPGYTWIEGTLDLEAEDFTLEHVRRLRGGLAAYSGLPLEALGIVSIRRWAPIVVLEMPATAAEWAVRAFEGSDPRLRDAFGDLPVESLKLDADGARRFSRPLPAPVTDDLRAFAAEVLGRGGSSIVTGVKVVALSLAVLVGALLTPLVWLVRRLPISDDWIAARRLAMEKWTTAAQNGTQGTIESLRRLVEDLRRLVKAGARIPTDGWGPANDVLWTADLRESLAAAKVRRGAGYWLQVGLILRELLRTAIVLAAGVVRWLVLFSRFAGGELREAGRGLREISGLRPEPPTVSGEIESPSGRSKARWRDDPDFWGRLEVILMLLAFLWIVWILSTLS